METDVLLHQFELFAPADGGLADARKKDLVRVRAA
jgi:hypothetical protein